MIARRDRELETRLILDALEKLPASIRHPYRQAVSRRLEEGQRLYGDRWALTPIDLLIRELTEEALDLGAWGVLARQRLDLAEITPNDYRQTVEAITGAIRAGGVAFGYLARIEEGRAER